MDPLSIAAGIVTFISVIHEMVKLYSKIKKYRRLYDFAQMAVKALAGEVHDFLGILNYFEQMFDSTQRLVASARKEQKFFSEFVCRAEALVTDINIFVDGLKMMVKSQRDDLSLVLAVKEFRAARRWKRSQPHLDLIKWQLTSKKRSLQLVISLKILQSQLQDLQQKQRDPLVQESELQRLRDKM